MGLVFALASLGLPGFGNFIAEFFILTGTFKASILMACLASLGLVASMIYSLRIVQKVFMGKEVKQWKIPDFTVREKLIYVSLVLAIFYVGLFPQRIIDTAKPGLTIILNSTASKNAVTTGTNQKGTLEGKYLKQFTQRLQVPNDE